MYFGAPDIIREAKSKLENFVMKPNKCIAYEGIFQQKILVCHVFVSLCDICKFWTLVCESCDIFGGYSQLEHLKG